MNHNERYNLAGTYQALEDLGLTKEAFLWRAAKGLFGAVASPLERILGRVGRSGLHLVQETGLPTKTLGALTRGAAQPAATGALLGGGMSAAMADPEQRWDAFTRGAAGGAIGGALYHTGARALRMGRGQLLGPTGMRGLRQAAGTESKFLPRYFGGFKEGLGQGTKQLGANVLLHGAPIAAGLGASMLAPTFEEDPQRQQSQHLARTMQPLVS